MYVLLNQDNVVTDVQRVNPASIFTPDYAARYIAAPDYVIVGYRKAGEVWDSSPLTPPVTPPAVPLTVTLRQAKLALLKASKLAAANDIIAALPGAQGDVARIEWECASTVERNNPTVLALAQALKLSDTQLDQLFIDAAKF